MSRSLRNEECPAWRRGKDTLSCSILEKGCYSLIRFTSQKYTGNTNRAVESGVQDLHECHSTQAPPANDVALVLELTSDGFSAPCLGMLVHLSWQMGEEPFPAASLILFWLRLTLGLTELGAVLALRATVGQTPCSS